MLQISQLFVYPVKSLGGVPVATSEITDKGLKYDRRWMLVNDHLSFITQREFPQMSLLKVQIGKGFLTISDKNFNNSDLIIPFDEFDNGQYDVTIWNAVCRANGTSKYIDQWFSDILKINCRLMFMPDETMRPVDTTSGYAPKGKFTSFADAYPFLMLSEESLNDLNTRLQTPVSINRFRPNLVFTGGTPYFEDELGDFEINEVKFTGLENCARCSIISINQDNAAISKEPLKTLSTYRRSENNVCFGRNIVHSGAGKISVGDEILIGQNIL